MSPHLNRQDIAKAAADIRPYTRHLAECPECRLQVELYRLAAVPEPLVDAPGYAIERVRAAVRPDKSSPVRSFLARLVFDSWADLSPAAVRGLGPDKERRLRFETDNLRFDLRAEKTGQTWTMAAQIKNLNATHQAFEIDSNAQRISERNDQFYIWSSPQPPRTIRLISSKTTVVLPEIMWTAQQSL